jgi:hypothetical protein
LRLKIRDAILKDAAALGEGIFRAFWAVRLVFLVPVLAIGISQTCSREVDEQEFYSSNLSDAVCDDLC